MTLWLQTGKLLVNFTSVLNHKLDETTTPNDNRRHRTESKNKVLTCSDVASQNQDQQAAADIHPHLLSDWSDSTDHSFCLSWEQELSCRVFTHVPITTQSHRVLICLSLFDWRTPTLPIRLLYDYIRCHDSYYRIQRKMKFLSTYMCLCKYTIISSDTEAAQETQELESDKNMCF